MAEGKPRGLVVFSGGSAANSLVDVFSTVSEDKQLSLSYIIPISDNGGSTSELIRFLGGPGIGDIRSRLVRLIPDDGREHGEMYAIKAFFNYRLSADSQQARVEWLDIVEARHDLWNGISSAKKELIRSFLNVVNLEIVKRMRPFSVFSFEKASVGNLFLTGARIFSGSLESAIYLLHSICAIPQTTAVIPAINTNFSHHISAGLRNGDVIAGQNAISHPSTFALARSPTDIAEFVEDANPPGALPSLRANNINFSKLPSTVDDDDSELPAPIDRIWYINHYGQEIRPPTNPRVLEALAAAHAVIYSIGSLYTSLAPCLILRGVGDVLSSSPARCKILILNGSIDRESGPAAHPMDAMDFVKAIARAIEQSRAPGLAAADDPSLFLARYVTHVIYIEGEGAPVVRREVFAAAGIELIRVYGRRANGGWRYDERALAQALQAVVGKKDLSRRNTLRG